MGEPSLHQSQSRSQSLSLSQSLSRLAQVLVALALFAGLVITLLVVWGSQ